MGFLFLFLMVTTIGTALAIPPATYQNHLLMPHSGFEKHSHLNCPSWRLAVETHNIRDWTQIPEACVGYVASYILGKQYRQDCDLISDEAYNYAKGLNLTGDGKDVWVFDVDETTLSNVPLLATTGWQLMAENSVEWFAKGESPAIPGPLKLYKKLVKLGFKIVFLTGLSKDFTEIRIRNLKAAGYTKWEKLILKKVDDNRGAVAYKSSERKALEEEGGYRIRGNMGDQWSDLVGTNTGDRTFKLPNPMYYVP
ncbi:hypothetical protein SSX86_013526 [Deinandra increscens subsp. villosa]|uniref:Acid phosphatase n=1 Tax=Deinandra increscens subsp. villosa TaxID=3103831 RepID=A0AAP0D052_9ASTR